MTQRSFLWPTRALLCLAMLPASLPAGAQTSQQIDFGRLVINVSQSQTAQVFHIVDQLSQWDQYAHKAYVRWAAKSLPLDDEEKALLRQHAEMRKARGWGNGFEQAFLVDEPIDAAAKGAAAAGTLTEKEATAEAAILNHFAVRLAPFIQQQTPVLNDFSRQLVADRRRLTALFDQIAKFAGSPGVVRVPVFLVANPELESGGGEANGGVIVVEAPAPHPQSAAIHEALHVLLRPRAAEIKTAAEAAGLSFDDLNEGIAYAMAPGLTEQNSDPLVEQLVTFLKRGTPAGNSYVRFYAIGAAIRPLLRQALESGQSLQDFLPLAARKARQVLAQ